MPANEQRDMCVWVWRGVFVCVWVGVAGCVVCVCVFST